MRIAVDLDNVTSNFQPAWADLYEEWFDLEVDRSKLTTWTSCVDETHFETEREFFAWYVERANGFFRQPLIPGALGAIDQLLADGHHIDFVTSRNGSSAEAQTRGWIVQNTPFVIGQQRGQVGLRMAAGTKAGYPYSLFIDDSPHVIEACIEASKPVIIFDQPWNSELVPPQGRSKSWARRALDWHEVLVLVKEIES